MFRRLLIALPIAALAVTTLFLAMRAFVPVGDPQSEYRIVISEQTVQAQLPEAERRRLRIVYDYFGPLPPSPSLQPQPEPGKPQPMPRDRFPAPELGEPETLMESRNIAEHCELRRTGAVVFLEGARDGDRVTVEFTITSGGRVTDVSVMKSTNPAINNAVVEMVRRWRWVRPGHCRRQLAVKQNPRTVRTEIHFRKRDGRKGALNGK